METLALAPLAPRDLHGCFSPGHGLCWQDTGDTIPVDLNSLPPALELAWGSQHVHLWFWLFLLSYIQLLQAGQDLIITHTKLKGEGCLPMSPLIFAIHHEQQRGGEGWRKVRFGSAGCRLHGWEHAGRGKVRRWCWCEHKCTHSGQQHAQDTNKMEIVMPQGRQELPAGSDRANPQVL